MKSALYHGADLFVLPTFSENFGVVVAEALTHEFPLVPKLRLGTQVSAAPAARRRPHPRQARSRPAGAGKIGVPKLELGNQ